MKLRKIPALLLAGAMLLSLVGCRSAQAASASGQASAQSGNSKSVDVLRIGTTKPADSFNIMTEDGSYGKMNYNSFCAAPFLELDNDGKIKPYIMTKWEVAADQMSIMASFATDQGVTWHDGKPLTMDDVIFTLNFLKDVKKSGYVKSLSGIEKINDTTLKLSFSSPAAFSTLNKMARFCYVYPKHIWESVEKYKEYTQANAAVGCGPYKLAGIDKEAQVVTYEAVDHYFKGTLTVKKVVVRSYNSHDALVMALRNGEIDAMYDYSNSLDSSMKPSITGTKNLDAGMSINPGNFQLVFGFNVAPTNDLSFRQAVSSALDYQLLATAIGGEDGEIAGVGIISSAVKGYDASLPKNVRNVEKAKSILDKAGYVDKNADGFCELPSGAEMSVLVTPQYNQTRSALYLRICEIIIQNLKEAGVKAVLDEESVRNTDYATKFRQSGQYQLYIGYTSPGVALYDAAFMYMVPNPNNPWGTCADEEFVAYYDKMMNSGNYDEYFANTKKTQGIASEKVVAIGLCWDKAYFPYRTDKYEGWINYAGWGVINGETWYNLKIKK